MEMDSSSRRRPFDRSLVARDPDPITLKKPRLITEEEEEETRPFISSMSNGGGGAVRLGFRQTVERDRDLEENGYEPQALSQLQIQQQQQELVNQYRTALSELTFNSKPIITNLTIIAGENVHSAKAIAATICNHILEVPSDQKLPSLYLLDSIVKNIGRDYLKYFAARLPEVFCTAYRQVSPVVQSGMRHLFGTWKGVFPPQSLQVIEKELGFQSAANGSSSGLTASRPEPQTQPPARSIHVNPKYLEARQRLQQSSTENSPTSDTNLINSPDAIERQGRRISTTTNAFRQRADPRLKNIQQAQRDVENASIRENDGAPYNDFDYGSDAGFGKSSGIVAEPGYDNSWYGPGRNIMETIPGQRNGFDTKHGFTNILAPKSENAGVKLPSTNNIRGNEVNRSWKNSEEDEYVWDGINSRLAKLRKPGSISSRDPRSHPEPGKLVFENRLQKPQGIQHINSRIDREALSDSPSTGVFRHQMPSLRSQGLSLGSSFNGVSASVNSLPKTSLQLQTRSSHIGAPGLGFPPSAMTVQQRHPLRAASPPGQAPTLHRPPTPSVATYNSSRILHSLVGHDRLITQPHAADNKPTQSRVQKGTGPPSQSSQGSFSVGNSQKQQMHNLMPLIPSKKHEPSSSPPTKMSVDAIPLVGTSLDHSKPPVISTPLATGNLVASVSGLFGINSRPPLPNFPPPTLSTSSSSNVVASRLSPSSHDTLLLSSSTSEKEAVKPSLPPVSSLLSTLVAKGLISASKTDSPVSQSIPAELPRKKKIPLTDDEPSLSNSAVKSPVNVPQLTTEDIKGIIGFEFKPDVIRRSHPSVVSELIVDDLPHQCHICGLRFKLQERFDKHIKWHTLKNTELNAPSKVSRRWFTHSDDWGKEKPEVESSDQTTGSMEIDGELMVVADESQCVCILCGEVFDDFYSQEMDKWLFRKAIYLCIEDGQAEDIVAAHGPIVHEHCISENSLSDLGLSNGDKLEKRASSSSKCYSIPS